MSQATTKTTKIAHGLTEALVLGDGPCRIWGNGAAERHSRILRRAGFSTIRTDGSAEQLCSPCLILDGAFIIDENLIRRLLLTPDTVLVAEDAAECLRPVAAHVASIDPASVAKLIATRSILAPASSWNGLLLQRPEELGSSFNRTLRKRAKPYALELTTENVAALEWRSFQESYKGATDFVTKLLWPVPAFHVTRACAARGISPNMVTTVGLLLMMLATGLFWNGWLLLGTLPAWAMTFLDTVDGKLARCTMTSSKWGDRYDHGVDLLHPPLWYYAWWMGLDTADPTVWFALWVILGGYLVGRLMEYAFKVLYGIQTHIWRPIDYYFRAVTARRNPNLAILTLFALIGIPLQGFLVVAAWTIVSSCFHLMRIVRQGYSRRAASPLTPGSLSRSPPTPDAKSLPQKSRS